MKFSSAQEFLDQPQKAVTVFGMSGVGKTTLGRLLRRFNWFLYSVDYRIGTHYMGEHIVDNFKREAMKVPFLRELLRSDSIYISSNITFDNLAPLSTYLGKPGNPDKGGISFDEYCRRQEQHRRAEIASLNDVALFIEKARSIYDYEHFLCDSGGSLCEVIDIDDPNDPVLEVLSGNSLMLWIEGTAEHNQTLIERFRQAPKPMYYQPAFLQAKWREYKQLHAIKEDAEVDPDGFAIWGFEQLVYHRLPLYEGIARNYGIKVQMREIETLRDEQDFLDMLCRALETQ